MENPADLIELQFSVSQQSEVANFKKLMKSQAVFSRIRAPRTPWESPLYFVYLRRIQLLQLVFKMTMRNYGQPLLVKAQSLKVFFCFVLFLYQLCTPIAAKTHNTPGIHKDPSLVKGKLLFSNLWAPMTFYPVSTSILQKSKVEYIRVNSSETMPS